MRRADFHYELPEELIAQHPSTERGDGRLLVLAGGRRVDRRFADLPECLRPGDLLVFNDTRVVRARLFARKDTGGRVELLLERVVEEAGRNKAAAGNQDGQQRLDAAAPDAQRTGDSRAGVVEEQQSRIALFHARASKPLRAGAVLHLQGGGRATVRARHEDLFELQLEAPVLDYLAHHGQVPLPPYIKRTDAADALDAERYQTVFARADGAVAAPTAGLHFDAALLERLAAAGVERAYVTLHVGAGTFQPVRVEDLSRHHMHRERFEVSAAVCEAVAAARARGGRVIAVGTTVVRSLESAWRGALTPTRAETDLFIRPGYQFRVVDALLTNFHLPESTLLMLVCAFGGTETVLAAYRHAVARQYRFFSYGDAMLVIPDEVATAARAAHPSTQEVR